MFEINEKFEKIIEKIKTDSKYLKKLSYIELYELIEYLNEYNKFLKQKKGE